jgi:hypothetical protein
MSYDKKCLELAEDFLPGDCPECKQLAQHIQDSIENWLTLKKSMPEYTNVED